MTQPYVNALIFSGYYDLDIRPIELIRSGFTVGRQVIGSFFISRGSPHRIKAHEDLRGLTIGVTRGSKYFIQFDDDTTLHKEIVHQATANFKKLILGRLDTMIIDESTGIDLINKLGIADQVEPTPYRFTRNKSVYIGISKNASLMEDLKEVEPVIQNMIKSGRIAQILKAYYTSRNIQVPSF